MLHLKKALVSSAFFIALLFSGQAISFDCPASHIDETAQVRHVHDGDTLRLKDGRRIRFIGIDTPELARKNQPEQPFAKQARDFVRRLLNRQQQQVGLSFGIEKQDKYKRQLAHLYLADGQSIQAALLNQGLAVAYTTPPNNRLSPCYQRAEAPARKAKRGIWSLPGYQLKSPSQLSRKDKGFRRIQGKVTRVYPSGKGLWILMGKKIRIQIRNRDLIYFKGYRLKQLTGKTIRIRGWLHPNRKSFYMNLRHPDNLRIQP